MGSSTTTIRGVVVLWPGPCSDAVLALVRLRMQMSKGKSTLLGACVLCINKLSSPLDGLVSRIGNPLP